MNQSFTIIEDFQFPNINTIKSFLTGASPNPIYIVRNYIDKNICEELKCVFYRILNRTNGGTRKGDFVPVLQIGATQFNKCTSDYLSDCQKTKPYINEILDSVANKFPNNDLLLNKSLQKAFKDDNIKFDASSYKDQNVNQFTIRKWTNANHAKLSLLPHEDLSQLGVAKKDNYEICTINRVIASNLCIANNLKGRLIIWNIKPEKQVKINLGIEYKGYPYPLSMLEGFQKLSVKINSGDLYFINANLIHAVEEINTGERITMGRFMGMCSENKIVYWT